MQHLPGLFISVVVVGSLALGGAVRAIPFSLFGTYLAWLYLRFVQSRNGVRWGRQCGRQARPAAAVAPHPAVASWGLPGNATWVLWMRCPRCMHCPSALISL